MNTIDKEYFQERLFDILIPKEFLFGNKSQSSSSAIAIKQQTKVSFHSYQEEMLSTLAAMKNIMYKHHIAHSYDVLVDSAITMDPDPEGSRIKNKGW